MTETTTNHTILASIPIMLMLMKSPEEEHLSSVALLLKHESISLLVSVSCVIYCRSLFVREDEENKKRSLVSFSERETSTQEKGSFCDTFSFFSPILLCVKRNEWQDSGRDFANTLHFRRTFQVKHRIWCSFCSVISLFFLLSIVVYKELWTSSFKFKWRVSMKRADWGAKNGTKAGQREWHDSQDDEKEEEGRHKRRMKGEHNSRRSWSLFFIPIVLKIQTRQERWLYTQRILNLSFWSRVPLELSSLSKKGDYLCFDENVVGKKRKARE